MNMSFVDVTDVPDAHVGSTVTLLGRDGDQEIDPNEQAALAGTIGYDLIARIPAAVPRRYVGYDAGARVPNSAIATARSSVPS
jgi:alanine racemase